MLKKALRLLGILAASTIVGWAILYFCELFHLTIPDFFVVWLPHLLVVDGESAYDAALDAFYIDMNILGIVLYLAIRRTFRPLAS